MSLSESCKLNLDISIIISAYNVERYIGEAISSAIEQNPPFKKIIIVDDGSTDTTPEVISRFTDSRIQHLKTEHLGPGVARNAGLELVDTEFIFFLDGDDILRPGLVSHFQRILSKHPSLDVFSFSSRDFEDGTGRTLESSKNYVRKAIGLFPTGKSAMLSSIESGVFPANVWLYIFRKTIISGHNYLRFFPIIHEDEAFTGQIFLNSGETYSSSDIYIDRRVRSNSIMRSGVSERNAIGYLVTSRFWFLKAIESSSCRTESRIFKRRSLGFHAGALVFAKKANISRRKIKHLIHQYNPSFYDGFYIDNIFLFLFSELARKLIAYRPRFLRSIGDI